MSAPAVSVLIPAYRAEHTIARAIASLQSQTLQNWEAIIIADDGQNYVDILNLPDPRLRFATTGTTRAGASRARNIGLDAAATNIIAMLDADDAFTPEKLALTVPHAQTHGLCVHPLHYVEYTPNTRRPITTLGQGPEGKLTPACYIQRHFAANCMLVFDKSRVHARWREDMPVLNDLLFTFTAFNDIPYAWHLNQPLQEYIYTENSLSTGPQAPPIYTAAKHDILRKLKANTLGLTNPDAVTALQNFMIISLEAEAQYAAALQKGEHVTFSELLASLMAIGKTGS